MSTIVYEQKKTNVEQVERPLFSTHDTTISVGTLKNGEIIAQVIKISLKVSIYDFV